MNWKVIVGCILLVLFLGVCYFLGGKMVDDRTVEEGVKPVPGQRSIIKATNGVVQVKRGRHARTSVTLPKKERAALMVKPTVNLSTNIVISETERKGLDALQLALDEESCERVRAASAQLTHSKSPYVRGKIVEALRWFKQPAVMDLRGMLNDSDTDVARDAKDGWLEAVTTITDEESKAKELYEGMTQIQDVDALREAVMEFYDIDDGLALQYIVNLINSGNPGAKQVGREGYEHIAGEPYTTPEAAQKWIETWRRDNPLQAPSQ